MSEYIEHDPAGISVGIVEKQFFTLAEPPQEMVLENGTRLGPITIAYETCGSLNAARDNAVLICHALSGDSHVAGYYSPEDPRPGWWDIMVGPGKAIDTNRYFVVCSNILGSCLGSTGPASIDPATGRPYGLRFPVIMIGHITYLSDEAMRRKFGRRLQDRSDFSFNFNGDFQVESYLRYQGKKFVERFDANSFLYITKAADYFDLGYQHGQGSLAKALSRSKAKYLVISFTSDWLYPSYQSRELVTVLKKNGLEVTFCEIKAEWGHDAFLLPSERLSAILEGFLECVSSEKRTGHDAL